MKLSPDLTLPVDAATGTFGILATKGAGKSNAAVVMAEEMWDAGIPWVAIDPKGDWWGLRSSEDGQGAGLPIIVFGGRHGDLPLEPTAGHLIANLVLEQRITCVLDVSQFTKADTIRFLLAFGEHLFRHADDGEVEPIHLFLEEAHEYLPQNVSTRRDGGDVAKLVNVWQRIVKQGRFKGLGVTMISQRSSVLNKDVLELIDTLIVLRTIGPRSRDSIKAWVAGQEVDPTLVDSLPGLADGEAWLWSPGELNLLQRFRFRRRRTFDSGATPKVGEVRKAPTTIADVDLAALKEAMADTIERAKADDPKELRKRIKDLERQLAAVPDVVAPEPVEVEVQVHSLPPGVLLSARSLAEEAHQVASSFDVFVGALERVDERPHRPGGATPAGPPARRAPARVAAPPAAHEPRPTRPAPTDDEPRLGKRERLILTVLARYPAGRTHRQIAMLTVYSPKASTIGAGMSALRKAGFVEASGSPIRITPEGIAHLGDDYEPLPQGAALLAYWRSQLGARERKFLDVLLAAYPDSVTHDEMAEATGYSPDASTVGAGMSKLRGLEIADGWRLHDDFYEATR